MNLEFSTFDITVEEFHQRRKWARAQGTPRWLWPEIAVERWQEALKVIEQALRAVITSGEAPKPLDGDPAVFGLAGYTSGTGPLLGYWLAQGKISASPPVAAAFELQFRHNRLRMEKMKRRASDNVEKLAEQGITATVLKGMHTGLAYFPDPGTRPATDIDLFIGDAVECGRANAMFESEGFVLTHRSPHEHSWRLASVAPEPRSILLEHADDPWTIDLHNSLNYVPAAGHRAVRLDDIATAIPAPSWPADETAKVLPQPILLLQLATHAGHAFHNLSLLRLVELVLVVRQDMANGKLQWDQFVALGRRAGALGVIYPALHLSEALIPGTIPGAVRAVCRHEAPTGVRKILDGLSPATVHHLDRMSVEEHFMWSRGWSGKVRQALHDAFPTLSMPALAAIYSLRLNALRRRSSW